MATLVCSPFLLHAFDTFPGLCTLLRLLWTCQQCPGLLKDYDKHHHRKKKAVSMYVGTFLLTMLTTFALERLELRPYTRTFTPRDGSPYRSAHFCR
jgi:hypothetical protein